MTIHLFRPADSEEAPTPPVGVSPTGTLAVAFTRVLTLLSVIRRSQQWRNSACIALLLLGLVVQGMMLLTAAYLVDLSVSLMELWAELARKHLELTL